MAAVVVLACAWTAVLLSWGYFRRFAVARPPIGVINLRDITFMIGGILVVPYLYLILPTWLVGGLLVLSAASVLSLVAEPVLRRRAPVWGATVILLAADLGLAHVSGTGSQRFLAVNDLLMVLMVVAITNLWAQSGMKARDVTILGGVLAIYDLVATSLLPLMGQTMGRLAGLPLNPLVAWRVEGGGTALIGLGDLLLAAVFPLVLRKAYGWRAGQGALALSLAALATLFALPLTTLFPVMVVLGPLMIAQYVFWARRGPERTTHAYLRAEPW